MLVKFISEHKIERYKGFVEIDGTAYANDEEKALSQGYKPLIVGEFPKVAKGYFPVSYYEESETSVYMRWRVQALTDENL